MNDADLSSSPADDDAKTHFREGVIWSFASLAVLAISGVALNVLIGAIYDEATLGIFNQVLACYIVAGMLAVGGLNFSALKLIAETPQNFTRVRDIAVSALLLTTACCTLVTAGFWLLRVPAARWLESPGVAEGMAWITPGLFFFGINKTLIGIVNGLHRMKAFAVFQGLRYFNLLLGFGLAVLLHFPGERLAAVFSFSECILCVVILLYLRGYWAAPFSGAWRQWIPGHLKFGVKGVMSLALLELNSRVDVLLLGWFLSDSLTGIYSFAAFIFEGFMQFIVALQSNYNPRLSHLLHAGKIAEMEAMFRRGRAAAYRYALFIIPAAVLLYPVGIYIVFDVVFAAQHEFAASWLPFALLMAGLLTAAGYMPFHGLLLMGSRPGWHTAFMLITVGINIAGNLLLIPLYGLAGSALATAIAMALSSATLILFVRKQLGVRLW